jgi:hypothetical protein
MCYLKSGSILIEQNDCSYRTKLQMIIVASNCVALARDHRRSCNHDTKYFTVSVPRPSLSYIAGRTISQYFATRSGSYTSAVLPEII